MEQKLTCRRQSYKSRWFFSWLQWSTQASQWMWLFLHQLLLFQKQGRHWTNTLAAPWQHSSLHCPPFLPPVYVWVPVYTSRHTPLPNYLYKLYLFTGRPLGIGKASDLETEITGFQSHLCHHVLWATLESLNSHLSKKDAVLYFGGALRIKGTKAGYWASSVAYRTQWMLFTNTSVRHCFKKCWEIILFPLKNLLEENRYSPII